MSDPKATVLMAIYNGLPYLREAIESVLGQTFTDFEFLILDDASTDASCEAVRSYDDSRIRLVQNEQNMGQIPMLNFPLLTLLEKPGPVLFWPRTGRTCIRTTKLRAGWCVMPFSMRGSPRWAQVAHTDQRGSFII